MTETDRLSSTQLQILRLIPKVKDVSALAREAKVQPATVGIEIAKLQMRGFISEDGTLSEKGLEAIGERS